jgi:ribosome-associated protein
MTEALAASLPLGAVQAGANTAKSLVRSDMSADALHQLVLTQLDDDQAQEIVSIPLAGKSSIADHMVIASGRSTRQVASMAQKLAEKIKQAGFGNARVEGLPAADWVLIDAGDVVVHLFRPEVRSFYNLERMWSFEGTETSMLGRN